MTEIDIFNSKVDNLDKFQFSISYANYLISQYRNREKGLKTYKFCKKSQNDFNVLLELKANNSDQFENKRNEIYSTFNNDFFEIYKDSHQKKYFYKYCSSEVYQLHFNENFQKFQTIKIDVNLMDFIIDELNIINHDFANIKNKLYLSKENYNFVKKSFIKKNDYLENTAKELGYKILKSATESNFPQNTFFSYKFENKGDVEIPLLDLSDTTATEKIIYLEKLGIIDFLRSKKLFLSVPDKVSQVISAITGIKVESVRPMVRPIINNDFENKNNPLNSPKAVERVEKKLINIGLNLNETI